MLQCGQFVFILHTTNSLMQHVLIWAVTMTLLDCWHPCMPACMPSYQHLRLAAVAAAAASAASAASAAAAAAAAEAR